MPPRSEMRRSPALPSAFRARQHDPHSAMAVLSAAE
jgi:hypothetical protein